MKIKNVIFMTLIIMLLLGLSIVLLENYDFQTFLTTIIVGIIVGLFSSFTISIYFEIGKSNRRKKVRGILLENFINACIEFSTSIEMWYNEYSSSSINVFENADLVLHTLKQLKEEYRKANNEKVKSIFSSLTNEYKYTITPVYHSYLLLGDKQLLITDVLDGDEYEFFDDFIRKSTIENHLSNVSKDADNEKASGEYMFFHLRFCLNCIIDAEKLFPQIKNGHNKRRKKKKKNEC